LQHVEQLLCDATLVGGSYTLDEFGGTQIATATFVSSYVNLLKPLFDTSTLFQSWSLQKFVSGAYVQVDADTIGVSGTAAASAPTPGLSWTWTFFDSNGKHVKFRQLGGFTSAAGAFKIPIGSLTGAFAAYSSDVLNHTATHIGAVMRGRSGTIITRGLNIVQAYNRKARRRLGVV
jgi:hypothetical protein